MDELVFAPDSAGGFLGRWGSAWSRSRSRQARSPVLRKGERVEPQAWLGFALFGGLGLVLAFLVYGDARAVVVHDGRVELRYAWPRPSTEIAIAQIKVARVVYAGTKRPSPHLEVELHDGTKYTGEGSSQHARVHAIVALIETLRRSELFTPTRAGCARSARSGSRRCRREICSTFASRQSCST